MRAYYSESDKRSYDLLFQGVYKRKKEGAKRITDGATVMQEEEKISLSRSSLDSKS